MPYFCDETSPEFQAMAELEDFRVAPRSMYEYVTPKERESSVISFPATPGIEPTIPDRPQYQTNVARPTARQGFFARLFGRRRPSISPVPTRTPEQQQEWIANYQAREKAISEHALWKLSAMVAPFRAAGVARILGSYDGGGDESFTYFQFVEMNDGRRIDCNGLDENGLSQIGLEELIEQATMALMGSYGAGEFSLHGALTVDVAACTITDEKDAATVFAYAERN
jgi:hypothetical protein